MAAADCGSLAIEYKHLQQQDEMAWVEQRFESRRPLSSSQKRQVRAGSAVATLRYQWSRSRGARRGAVLT